MALGGGTFAQLQYWATVYGQVSGCTPGQVITVTTSYQTVTTTVDPNCWYSVDIYTAANPDTIITSTPCQGAIQTVMSNVTFNSVFDSAMVYVNFNCGGGGTPDCLGIPGGPNVPGASCVDFFGNQGVWDVNCTCDTTSVNTYDCLGILNGPNMPGTACTDSLGGILFTGVWDATCSCVTNGLIDCMGQLNGPALPGTPCDDGNPATINDTWTSTCACVGNGGLPCQASFWVLQAFTVDSLNNPTPIPYEVWVWNLSSGGSGTYSYLWSFGDGTSSTAQFPTHTYSGNGPYLLCLTIDDGAGCISTWCDSVSIDANGIYNGIMAGGSRQNGFTLNVQQPLSTGVAEVRTNGTVALWPNPVTDDLNVAVADAIAGATDVTVLDASGRVVLADRRNLSTGRNQFSLPTAQLSPGLYTLRIGNGERTSSQRFVKTF